MTLHSSLVFLTLLVPATAVADAAGDLSNELDLHFSYWSTYRDDPGSRATSIRNDPTPDDCDAAVARGRKAGLRDDSRIHSTRFDSSWAELEYDDKQQGYILVKDVARICKQWRTQLLIVPAAYAQTDMARKVEVYAPIVAADPARLGGGMGDQFAEQANECLDITDKAIKLGAPTDVKVKIADKAQTLAEGRQICVDALAWAKKSEETIAAARKAAFEEAAKPWRALGVDGAKLELFVKYESAGWVGGKHCQLIEDKKQLAKAKVLFLWFGDTYGQQEMRKYTFTGNKVSGPIVKYYDSRENAQRRGCK